MRRRSKKAAVECGGNLISLHNEITAALIDILAYHCIAIDLAAYQVAAEITGTDECAMEAISAGANGETVSAKCIALLGEVDKAMVRKEHECMVSLGTKK